MNISIFSKKICVGTLIRFRRFFGVGVYGTSEEWQSGRSSTWGGSSSRPPLRPTSSPAAPPSSPSCASPCRKTHSVTSLNILPLSISRATSFLIYRHCGSIRLQGTVSSELYARQAHRRKYGPEKQTQSRFRFFSVSVSVATIRFLKFIHNK